MTIMLLIVGLLFGAIFAFQVFKAYKIKEFFASNTAPPVTVTAMKAEFNTWQPQIDAVGSLRAERGVDVASEIDGIVRSLHFKSGEEVKAGQVLVQLNADADIALLHSLQAAAELARTTYERDKAQYAARAISQATLDAAAADLKSKSAQVAGQKALVDKKIIVAPFAGRLGISTVNPGQYLNPGDKIVTLQSLDPIFVDFYLPQQQLSSVALDQAVVVASDSYPGQTFTGKISAISPLVDPNTRNVQIEATVANPKHLLLPGMFASLDVEAGTAQRYLTLPQTAVTFNPYGESLYIVEPGGKGADGKSMLIARQSFVTVGATRGDQIAVLQGIKEGDLIVTSGQLKLRNGSPVIINNTVPPSNEPAPKPVDE
ncbi:MAG TPA: efflux RND transporter periplasmic adaptor subunit [Candidatus Methylomirabilis sp.]|nr:efflux RND transporter periplasmic adaptor subunit [Candidatus Methylomirabilis sp.]